MKARFWKTRVVCLACLIIGVAVSSVPALETAPEFSGAHSGRLVWEGTVVMRDDLLILAGGELIIRPGTQVRVVPAEGTKIDPEYLSSLTELLIRGRLDIQGTAAAPVRFVIDGDVAGGEPAWAGITLDRAAPSRIAHVDIVSAEMAIRCVASSPEIVGSRITASREGIVAQALHWLKVFGGTALFGGFLSVVLVREIAPVLVGLILIGRSGSVILAELGTMKAEGQIHMLDAQGIDPFLYLVVPRVLALSICMFCLTVAFVAVALMAGFVSGILLGLTKFTFLDFIHRALDSMGRQEYLSIAAKTLTIGFAVGLIACKEALALSGSAVDVLDILPRSFAKSVLATLVISVVLTILL